MSSKTITVAGCYEYITDKIFPGTPVDPELVRLNWPGKVGIELEMLPVRVSIDNGIPDVLALHPSPHLKVDSTIGILTELAQEKKWRAIYFPQAAPEEALIVEKFAVNDNEAITFEPGGQVEFSTMPFFCLSGACDQLSNLQKLLADQFRRRDVTLIQLGMNPWHSLDEIGLQMSKKRYIAMDQFFRQDGVYGQRMMRQTMSVQVSIDFGDPQNTLAKRYLAANILAPFAGALFANSPFLHGKLTDLASQRIECWLNMDATHTGFPDLTELEGSPAREQVIKTYCNFALDANVVFVEARDYEVPPSKLTFRQWIDSGYYGVFPDEQAWQTHLSLLFPEVRAKGFLELRSCDAQFHLWQGVPAAFFVGLLYDEDNLNWILATFRGSLRKLPSLWKKSVFGLREKELASGAKILMEKAIEGMRRLPECFRSSGNLETLILFAKTFTYQNLCPADVVRTWHQDTDTPVSVNSLKKLEENWENLY